MAVLPVITAPARPQRGRHVVVRAGTLSANASRAQRLADPGDHVQVLDRDRARRSAAAATSGSAARGDGLLGRAAWSRGQVGGDRVEGADLGVQPLDAVEVMAGDLDRRQLTLADRRGQLQSP